MDTMTEELIKAIGNLAKTAEEIGRLKERKNSKNEFIRKCAEQDLSRKTEKYNRLMAVIIEAGQGEHDND